MKSSLKRTTVLLLFGVVIASTAIYWYKSQKQVEESINQSVPTVSTQPVITTEDIDIKEALKNKITQFYKDYVKLQPDSLDILYKKGELTLDAYTMLKKPYAYDPVLCTQGGSQSPVEVDSVTINGQTATVVAKQYYEGSKTYKYITINLELSDQKIIAITCSMR